MPSRAVMRWISSAEGSRFLSLIGNPVCFDQLMLEAGLDPFSPYFPHFPWLSPLYCKHLSLRGPVSAQVDTDLIQITGIAHRRQR